MKGRNSSNPRLKESSTCALCNVPITSENRSDEHIIPQALGARLVSKEFICISCNNKTGKGWDAEAIEQLAYVSVRLGIKRQKGAPPPVQVELTTGEKYKIHPDGQLSKTGKPIIHAPEDAAEGTFSVHADTVERAKKIASNLKKKYEKMGAKVETLEPTNNPEMVSGEIQQGLSMGGEHANKSHVKTALAYAAHCGIAVSKCDIALSFVKGADIDCIGLWYGQDLVIDREERDVFHCVSVWGDPGSGRLLAYVEHYGAMRYLICLSNTYTASAFANSYIVDPRTGGKIERTVDLSLIPKQIGLLAFHQFYDKDNFGEALWQLNVAIQIRSDRLHNKRVLDEAYNQIISEMGINENDVLSDTQWNEFSHRLSALVVPKLAHMLRSFGKK